MCGTKLQDLVFNILSKETSITKQRHEAIFSEVLSFEQMFLYYVLSNSVLTRISLFPRLVLICDRNNFTHKSISIFDIYIIRAQGLDLLNEKNKNK